MHRPQAAATQRRARAASALALVIAVLTAASACGGDQAPQVSTAAATTTTTIPFGNFVGMNHVVPRDELLQMDPERWPESHDVLGDVVHGIVEIDGPCLYIHQLETWGDGGFYRDSYGVIQTYLLKLPYNLTRYDSRTQSLWVDGKGPITKGSKATAFGLPTPNRYSEACPLANSGALSGSLVPGVAEILCRGDGVGITGVMPGAGEDQPCV